MYLTCTKADLSAVLTRLAKVSTQKSVLPILSCVLLTTEKEHLVLTTTDFSLTLKCRIPACVLRAGTVCIPAKLFSDIVKNEPDNILLLQRREESALILESFTPTVRSRTRLKSMNPEDFPQLPKRDDEERRLTLDSTAFKKMLGSVLPFATRTTQSGDTTSNVQFTISRDKLSLTATDRYRMAIGSLSIKNDEEEYSFLLGEELLRKVLPMLPENEHIQLTMSKELVSLVLPGLSLYMRTSSEPFVDTTKSLEGVPETTITVDRTKLSKALKRLSSMIEDKKSYGDIYSAQLETREGMLILSPRRKREGVETMQVPLGAQVEGQHVLYNFERKWLSALAEKMQGVGTITLAFNREKETLLLRPLVPNGLIYVMKVEDATKVTQEKNPGVDEKNDKERVSHPSS